MAKDNKQRGLFLGSIAIGILAIAMVGISLSVWAKPYTSAYDSTKAIVKAVSDTTKTLVITGEADETFADSKLVDTLAINAAFLKKMRENGELLSSDEFASRITGYYNTLVAVLTALFVLFTIVTYMTIRSKFEGKLEEKAKEFETKAKDLEDKQHQKIIEELRNMLNDSKKLDEVIKSVVGGHIDDTIATKEEVEGLTSDMETYGKNLVSLTSNLDDINKKQQTLFKVVDDLQEQVSAKATVYANNAAAVEEKPDEDSAPEVEPKTEE